MSEMSVAEQRYKAVLGSDCGRSNYYSSINRTGTPEPNPRAMTVFTYTEGMVNCLRRS